MSFLLIKLFSKSLLRVDASSLLPALPKNSSRILISCLLTPKRQVLTTVYKSGVYLFVMILEQSFVFKVSCLSSWIPSVTAPL